MKNQEMSFTEAGLLLVSIGILSTSILVLALSIFG